MSKPLQTLGISKLRLAELTSSTYLSLLAQHEVACSILYKTFAKAYPGMKELWTQLAKEEDQHFDYLLSLKKDIINAEFSFKRPRFTQSLIRESLAWINGCKERAEAGAVTVREALEICIQIEKGMVEHRFFQIIDGDGPEIQKIFSQLEKYTGAHLERVVKEAARFKWKLFGGKRSRNIPVDARIPMPTEDEIIDPNALVIKAQTEILEALIAMEQAGALLYNTYAELLPDQSALWSRLSAEENGHASMLERLEEMLKKGSLFRNLGQFGLKDIRKTIDEILNQELLARRNGTTSRAALIYALKLECAMAECQFYKTVDSDAPEFKIIAARLVEHTNEHINRLKEATSDMMKGVSNYPDSSGQEEKPGADQAGE